MIYTLNGHKNLQLSPTWCYLFELCMETAPQAFRTASKWLTVALAIQRYIYACFPYMAERLCTLRTSKIIITSLLSLAVIQMIPRTIDRQYMIHIESIFSTYLTIYFFLFKGIHHVLPSAMYILPIGQTWLQSMFTLWYSSGIGLSLPIWFPVLHLLFLIFFFSWHSEKWIKEGRTCQWDQELVGIGGVL